MKDIADQVVAAFYDEVRQKYDGALAFCRGEAVPPEATEEWRAGWAEAQRNFASRKRGSAA